MSGVKIISQMARSRGKLTFKVKAVLSINGADMNDFASTLLLEKRKYCLNSLLVRELICSEAEADNMALP